VTPALLAAAPRLAADVAARLAALAVRRGP
jgi:hypothetical protein